MLDKVTQLFNTRNQLLLLLLVVLGLNCNTLFHEYTLDDCVVMTENRFVAKGISGIPEILSSEYVSGYSTQQNILTGARYRPLSLLTFAIEYQFFGANPLVSHALNILLFLLLIFLLFKLLNTHLFQDEHPLLAFTSCLLFASHPIHTEVIANVKSRDEILTLIFLVLSTSQYIQYLLKGKKSALILSLTCFILALLTKETAVTFIGIIPLVLYFFFFKSIQKSLESAVPFLLVFIAYIGIRYVTVGFANYPVIDVTNSPYLYATSSEAFASKVYILFYYIKLLVFPHPLCSDYGYNEIPYTEIHSLQFALSLVFVISLFVYAIVNFNRRFLLSFCILFYAVTLSVATNFIVDLGAPLAERMLFQPSLAFCIALSFLFLRVSTKRPLLSFSFFVLFFFFYSAKTVVRNADWKNNETLILTDVETAPNCSRLNLYACEKYILKASTETDSFLKKDYIDRAVLYGEKSFQLHHRFAYAYQRLAAAYYYQKKYFKSADLWIQAAALDTANAVTKEWCNNFSFELFNLGNEFLNQKNYPEAIRYFSTSAEMYPAAIEAWYNLGGAYYLNKDTANGNQAWSKVKQMNPAHKLNKSDFLGQINSSNL